MHSGVITLLILVGSLQVLLHEAEAQVAVESLAGLGAAQSGAYSQLGVQKQVPIYPPSAYPPVVYPPSVYPSYPVVEQPSVLTSLYRFFKSLILTLLFFPLKIFFSIKAAIDALLGINNDYGYYPAYPYASVQSLFK